MPQTLFFIYRFYVASSDSELPAKQRIFYFWCPIWTWDYPSQRPGPLLHNRRHRVRECTSTHIYASCRHINSPPQLVTTRIIRQITETCVT